MAWHQANDVSRRLATIPGVGPITASTVGVSYDNALAETINGLYKTKVIHKGGPWRSLKAVEYATLEWVHRRPLEQIGNVPPAEAEARHYASLEVQRHGRLTQENQPPANPAWFTGVLVICIDGSSSGK